MPLISLPKRSAEVPVNGSSRLRISKEDATALGARQADQSIEFIGYFRAPGELICVLSDAKFDGLHPLNGVLGRLESPEEAGSPVLLEDLPDSSLLVLPDRLATFQATWTSEKAQLNLNVGADLLGRLAYTGESGRRCVRLIIRNRFLVLMTDEHYRASAAENLSRRV